MPSFRRVQTKVQKDKNKYFFPRGHGNEFSNLIGSLRGPDFPISAHGHGKRLREFLSFCLQSHLSAKAFFKTAFYWTTKLKNKSSLFKTDSYYNIKMKKFLFTTSVSLLHL